MTLFIVILSGLFILALARLSSWLDDRFLNNHVETKFTWDDEIVLVTGGSRGIGAATVRRLAGLGIVVVVLDLVPFEGDMPDNVYFYQCDVSNLPALQSVHRRISRDIGPPTILIINAAIFHASPLLLAPSKSATQTVHVNLLGPPLDPPSLPPRPRLKKPRPHHPPLVTNRLPHHRNSTLYSATKAAVVSLYEGLQSELRHHPTGDKVRVSIVKPSHVRTEMFNGIQKVPGMFSVGPEDVANSIWDVLRGGRSRDVWVPREASFTRWIRVLPGWIRVLLQDLTVGAFEGMS